ncbi:DNA methylase N-4/N-6 domain-containing protein [Salinarchaeum sp. Harcht-Bsk1]|nr:DNA methylase N-4/N-6 domain-containing protein [Salinarchaeum sp. Harcht-Bsk1]
MATKVGCAQSTAWRRLSQLADIGAVDRHGEELPLTWEARLYVPWTNVSDLPVSWRNAPRGWGNPLHTIAPYIGGFPPALAHYFIKRFSDPSDVVCDPFAGGGTVPLEAILNDRDGWGSDAFEYASTLTQAKCNPMSTPEFEDYIDHVLKKAETIDSPLELLNDDRPPVFFSDYTLKQLLAVREVLRDEETGEANYLNAIISGVLHGPSEMFLSLSTRDTFSGSVDYVRDYAEKHDLERPNREIRTSAMTKQELVSEELDALPDDVSTWIEKSDCRDLPFPDGSVDLLLTSPPYMRVLDYSWNNWLRLWWLDADRESEREELTITESERKYKEFVRGTLMEIERVLTDDGYAVIVVGDVRKVLANRTEYFNTAQLFAEEAVEHTDLIPRRVLNDEYDLDTRNYAMTNQLRYEYSKDAKEEKAMSKLDRCLILSAHQQPLPASDSINVPWV